MKENTNKKAGDKENRKLFTYLWLIAAAHVVQCRTVGLFVNELETVWTEAGSEESEVLFQNLPGVGSGIQRNTCQKPEKQVGIRT
jgi:hypothetical protein